MGEIFRDYSSSHPFSAPGRLLTKVTKPRGILRSTRLERENTKLLVFGPPADPPNRKKRRTLAGPRGTGLLKLAPSTRSRDGVLRLCKHVRQGNEVQALPRHQGPLKYRDRDETRRETQHPESSTGRPEYQHGCTDCTVPPR